jgi:DNA-binding Lrp family transcriptional regulator
MKKGKGLDEYEKAILKQLIRDPRLSDNQIAKRTGIPLKTVNRKRKGMEESGNLMYFAYFNNSLEGSREFTARKMYVILLDEGITKKRVREAFHADKNPKPFRSKHLLHAFIGEYQGHIIIVAILESLVADDIVEIYNADLVPWLHNAFGPNAINRTMIMDLDIQTRILHNYLPYLFEMPKGRLGDAIKDEWIYVGEEYKNL